MKATVISINNRAGTSPKNGNAYEISECSVLVPISLGQQTTISEHNTFQQYGHKVWKSNIDTSVFTKLLEQKDKFPITVTLTIDEVLDSDDKLIKVITDVLIDKR